MRWFVVLLAVALARGAHAECPRDKTVPVARGAIVLDGVLDDPTWVGACSATGFTQKQPVFGAPPTWPLRVMFAIDEHALYVGARMWSAGPDDVSAALTQRDDTSQAERLIVSLDPQHTRRLAYSFAVTARGVRADWIHTDDSEGKRDLSWNPVWHAEARQWGDGWSVELKIPLSQLRLPSTPDERWGINVNWYIPHRQEDVFWIAVPRDRVAWASWFGQLTALPPIRPGVALELLPYLASRASFDSAPVPRLGARRLVGLEAGLDVKLRPSPGFTVAATFNPDFGQVDADPSFVNLSAFEVRLPERRPFFVENNALFAGAGGNYFYSRRIGALPRVMPAADVLVLPQQARILGALAAGGFLGPSTQIAVLGAVTDRAEADAVVDGQARSLVVAPLTGWAAARVERQLGASVVGATATAVGRALDATGLEELLPGSAFVLGGDARLRTDDRAYELALAGGATSVLGSGPALTLVQRSSARFYQRPDASHVALDPDRRSLTGWHAAATGAKRAGQWQGTATVNLESPDYELNDVGQLASADDIDGGFDVNRIVTESTEDVFQWSLGAGAYAATNFEGLRKPVELHGRGDVTFASFRSAALSARVVTPGLSDDLTRGGPRMKTGWAGSGSLDVSTPRGMAHQLSGRVTVELSPTLQQGVTASISGTTRVAPSLRLDVTPALSMVENGRQYVTSSTAPGGGERTYATRYVFGRLARREGSVELRATWSLSPDLALTFYAQPFYSRGSYAELGELSAPGSDRLRLYEASRRAGAQREIDDRGATFSIAEPDFRVLSLRSTAVLRWEPRPGSTLFAVWQQAREQARTLHTIALKLSWWFG